MPTQSTIPPSPTVAIKRECPQCGAAFLASPRQVAVGQGKFCSATCYHASRHRTPEELREKKREYNRRQRENIRAWREANADHLKTEKARWQRDNPERYRESAKRHRVNRRMAMIVAYGGACACCGETCPTFLTLDHINGNGGAHRRALGARGNDKIIRQLAKEGWPQGEYRLLCWNCQFGVQQPGGCPHQRH